MTFCPTGRVGRYFLRTPLPHHTVPPAFEPDVLLSDGRSLRPLGVGCCGYRQAHARTYKRVYLGRA